jgi:hypothetical protein
LKKYEIIINDIVETYYKEYDYTKREAYVTSVCFECKKEWTRFTYIDIPVSLFLVSCPDCTTETATVI